MNLRLEQIWQRWGDSVRFLLWGLTLALVCFLLYRMAVNSNISHSKTHISAAQRDSLLTIAIPDAINDTLLRYEAFNVHFNSERGIANCTVYELVSGELNGTAERANEFAQDFGVKGCPSPDNYIGSGMDRGHLVPAGDLKWSEQAMRQSFLLTNVCPMHKSLNEGGWAKLEEKVREWTARDSALLVYSGPIVNHGDSTLKDSHVTVPSHFFKIVMAPCVQPRRAIAFVYPNGKSGGRLNDYAVSVDDVERLTGMDFFPTLPAQEQHRLESVVNLDAWTN